jgi:hypothetical protein
VFREGAHSVSDIGFHRLPSVNDAVDLC